MPNNLPTTVCLRQGTFTLELSCGTKSWEQQAKLYGVFHVKDKIVAKDKRYTCSNRAKTVTKDKAYIYPDRVTALARNQKTLKQIRTQRMLKRVGIRHC